MIGVMLLLIDEARRRGLCMLNVLRGRPTAYRIQVVGRIVPSRDSRVEECQLTVNDGRHVSIGLADRQRGNVDGLVGAR